MSRLKYIPRPLRARAVATVTALVRATRAPFWPAFKAQDQMTAGPLLVSGFMSEVLGVGRAAQMSFERFQAAGLHPIAHDLRPALQHYPLGGLSLPPGDGGVWYLHVNAPECDVALQTFRAEAWAQRYRIGYWAWETTLAPRSWVTPAKWLHEIWTPSRFTRDALARAFSAAGHSELSQKLKVMPHPAPRMTARPDRARFGLGPTDFIALTSFDGRSAYARKNPMGAIQAWRIAYPRPEAGRTLVVKAVVSGQDPRALAELRRLIEDRSDIVLLTDLLDEAGMASLVASVDLVISLHRAEGFGLMMSEALSLGRAVLTTAYSATGEYLNEDCAFLAGFTEVPVRDPSGAYRQGDWSDPDLEDAAQQLRAAESVQLRQSRAANAPKVLQALDAHWSREKFDAQPWRRLVRAESGPVLDKPASIVG